MPMYNFLCGDCNHITADLQKMSLDKEPVACEECGGDTEFTLQVRHELVNGDKERTSVSLGVHPSQIADGSAFKLHPGARFNSRGDMILKNRTEHKKRLKERGWVNRDDYN